MAELAATTQSANTVDEAVFMSTFIPRSLAEVSNCEADLRKLDKGEQEVGHASAVASMINRGGQDTTIATERSATTEGANEGDVNNELEMNNTSSKDDEDEDDDDDENDDDDGDEDLSKMGWRWDGDTKGRLPPAGSDARASAKEKKKAEAKKVKEEKRESRKNKLPKHIKKSKIKSTGVKGNK